MKKLLIMLCMLTCIFGLTACGSEQEISQAQQSKIDYAEQMVVNTIIPTMQGFADDRVAEDFLSYRAEELEYLFENQVGMLVEGSGIMGAINSFNSSLKETGELVEIGEPEGSVDGDTIVVHVPVKGERKDGEIEVILENTIFLRVEACTLNLQESMGSLMERAAMNTLLGMGTVFCVLILISFIISAFNLIPKMQAAMTKKKKGKTEEVRTEAVDHTIAQIVEKEELSDDLELVAVIAAAIAASNGSASTDGFVVRSIKRANKRRW